VEELIKILDLEWEYDNDYSDDTCRTYFLYDMESAVELDCEKKIFSVYKMFSYEDEDENDNDEDEIYLYQENQLANEYTYIDEKAFTTFLQQQGRYNVDVWDDGCYMCPGYVTHIGYNDLEANTNILEDFLDVANRYEDEFKSFEQNIDYLIKKYSEKHSRVNMIYDRRLGIKIGQDKMDISEFYNVDSVFDGSEYIFFICNDKRYFASSEDYILAKRFIDNNCYSKSKMLCDGNEFVLFNRLTYAKIFIEPFPENNEFYASQIEESFVISKINQFLPYASSNMKRFHGYYAGNVNKISNSNEGIPMIITEGTTDWKHLKRAWERMKQDPILANKYEGILFDFLEYEPSNSKIEARTKLQMDCNVLLSMCNAYSMTNKGKYIFIADRDVSSIVQEMRGTSDKPYKDWGNNVYSFVLPVPMSRMDSPEICIEHYYDDVELKTEKTCNDGIKRRLFLSNEFDEYGRSIKIDRFCINRAACNGKLIKVLDGSRNDKVIGLSADISDKTNYALSKMEFVNALINDKDFEAVSYENFILIFDIIMEICKVIKEKKNEIIQ